MDSQAAQPAQNPELIKGLGLTSATTLVMGSMIGSGIFIVSADIARMTDSPALLIAAWMVTGFMTIVGALCYGELAAMMPKAGGQYVFLREALGPMWGFLYGWTLFLVIQTGTIAAVGVAFGKFLGYFFPDVSADNWIFRIPSFHIGTLAFDQVGLTTQSLAGIVIVLLLTFINVFGVRTGALVQNVFTIAKVGALALLIVVAVFVGANSQAVSQNFGDFWRNASLGAMHPIEMPGAGIALVTTLVVIAVAQTGSLFSADAWNNVTFTAAEVKNPSRNLPLALAMGTGIVITLYILANFVYLMVLPLHGDKYGFSDMARGIQYANQDRVGTAVMLQMFGATGAAIMAVAILISTFGCNNGLILSGARVYYAMAKDKLFFKSVGNLHPTYKTPVMALIIQAVWTCILCISGTYNNLLDYIVFAVLIFYILTIFSLFVLRKKWSDAVRPYKAFGYPFLPAIYILLAVFIDIVLLRYKTQYSMAGLVIVLLGVPVYFIWSRKSKAATV